MSIKPIYRFESNNANEYSEFSIDISTGTLLLKNTNGRTIQFNNDWNTLRNVPKSSITLTGAVSGNVEFDYKDVVINTQFDMRILDKRLNEILSGFATKRDIEELRKNIHVDSATGVLWSVNGKKVDSLNLYSGKNTSLTIEGDNVIISSVSRWDDILGKPEEFIPAVHSHVVKWSDIEGKPDFSFVNDVSWEEIRKLLDSIDPAGVKPVERVVKEYVDKAVSWDDISDKPELLSIDHSHTVSWDDIEGKPELLSIDHSHTVFWNDIEGKPELLDNNHSHDVYWDDIENKPKQFTPTEHTHVISWDNILDKPDLSVFWNDIGNKPNQFVPTEHSHTVSWNEIQNKPTQFVPTHHKHDDKVDNSIIGQPNGLAVLNDSGHIATHQLPSYVDEIVEYQSATKFPFPGTKSRIYIANDTYFVYRWTGRTYIRVNDAVSLSDEALRLSTARRIQIKGDVSGMTYFDGSKDAEIHTTISTIDGGEF